MADPFYWKGAEAILGAPSNWDVERDGPCLGLPIVRHNNCCVSIWKPTPCERLLIAYGGNIVVWVHSGVTQPPVSIGAIEPMDGVVMRS